MSSSVLQDPDQMRADLTQEERMHVEKSSPDWQPSVPFMNRIPKPEGDMYEKLLAPLLERDKMQCDAWKDEVQNLLIFAGLFSAVVTAFIVESYKGLQPDPNDTVASLLLRIADRLDSPLNASTVTSPLQHWIDGFDPTPSSIRVNTLWFISLVLSLTTVLMGIISLQWLREHQQYDNFHGSELKFAIFNLRAESLARWYVPQIFASMPLTLEAALVLFFVGTIDFLLALSRDVARPVIAVTGIPFFFLLATTLLPAFQAYTLRFPFLLQVNDKVPVPIPFKSPQSNIIRRLSAFSNHLFFLSACIFAPFYLLIVAFPSHASKAVKQLLVWGAVEIHTLAPFLKNVYYTWSKHLDFALFHEYWTDSGSWTSSDTRWPQIRTQYASLLHECTESEKSTFIIDRRTHGTGVWDFSRWIPNVYDCTRGFSKILKQTRDYDQVCRVGHCGEELSSQYIQSLWNYKMKFAAPLRSSIVWSKSRALESLLRFKDASYEDDQDPFIWPLGDWEDPINFDVMHGLHLRAVLSAIIQLHYHTEQKPQNINIRLAWTECQLNLMRPLLVKHPNLILFGNLDDQPLFLDLFCKHKVTFIPDVSQQWTSVLQQFLVNTATTDLLQYTAKPQGKETVRLKALDIVLWEVVDLQRPEDGFSTMQFLAQILLSASIKATETKTTIQRLDFLAFASCRYLLAWLNNGRDVPHDFLPAQAMELWGALKAYINPLGETSSRSKHELRDGRIRRRLEYNFNIMATRFGEKYPAYVVDSQYNLTSVATGSWQLLNLMSDQDEQGRSMVSLPDDNTREHYERDSIV